MGRFYWVAMLPVKAILYITVPDCRLPGRWRKLYPLTFIMSVAWTAVFSYIMVWMITIAGTLYSTFVYVIEIMARGTELHPLF